MQSSHAIGHALVSLGKTVKSTLEPLLTILLATAVTAFPRPHSSAPATVADWSRTALRSGPAAKLDSPGASRAQAVVHTCMYDAWAAYDDKAVGTQLGGALRRPPAERTEANKERAVSYAAYRALTTSVQCF